MCLFFGSGITNKKLKRATADVNKNKKQMILKIPIDSNLENACRAGISHKCVSSAHLGGENSSSCILNLMVRI